MAERTRIASAKPVKNPLLTGAGHGFPFENFQGSSLLVPVSQESPSVLGGDLGEADKFLGQDSPGVGTLTDPLQTAPDVSSRPAEVSNQGYTGLFSAFFGGSQSKEEPDPAPPRPVPTDPQPSSISSTPRSYSPYVHVQSYSPPLEVPRESPTAAQRIGNAPPGIGFANLQATSLDTNPPTFYNPSQQQFPSSQPLPNFLNPTLPFPSPAILAEQQQPLSAQPFMPVSFLPPQQQPPPQLQAFAAPPQQPLQPPPLIGGQPPPPFFNADPSAPLPPPAGAPRTFRLGQQKRLAYAPLPGLTSNAPVQFQAFEPVQPVASALFTPPTAPQPYPVGSSPSLASSTGSAEAGLPAAGTATLFPSPGSFAAPPISGGYSAPPLFPTPPPTKLVPSSSAPFLPASSTPPANFSLGPSPPQPVSAPIVPPSDISSFPPAPQHLPSHPSVSSLPPAVSSSPVPASSIPPPSSTPLGISAPPPVSVNPNAPPSTYLPPSFPPVVAPSSGNILPAQIPAQVLFPETSTSVPPTEFQPSLFSSSTAYSAAVNPFPPPPSVPFSSTSTFPHSSSSPSFPSSASGALTAPLFTSESSVPSVFSPIPNTAFNPPPVITPTVSLFNRPTAVHPSVSGPIMSSTEHAPVDLSATPRTPSPSVIPPSLNNLANHGHAAVIYRPAYHHWFWKRNAEAREVWKPFSMTDSLALEQAYNSADLTINTTVATDGGRHDVKVVDRLRYAVYWEEEPKEVRRCSWYYGSAAEKLRPYDENTAYVLEEEYKAAVTSGTWRNKISVGDGEFVLLHGPNKMEHYHYPVSPNAWEAVQDLSETEPRFNVKRGVHDLEIDEGESPLVDHVVFVVHGVGSVCDLRLRTIEEAVEVFRTVSHTLIRSHYHSSVDLGLVNRVEVLPVSWHHNLHGETTGLDRKVHTLTLKSIPKVRHFMNDCLLDILYYTSPVYCQNIQQKVAGDINTLLDKFRARNPCFTGGVSLIGHSLGSLILFDMLCHQKPPTPMAEGSRESTPSASPAEEEVSDLTKPLPSKRRLSRNVSYVVGIAGTGQPFINYPQLSFHPTAFFAMGSPIGMFVAVRGIDTLGLDFKLPTCPGFFNIFHPYDPVAYRIEALIKPDLADRRPVLIPHHKGRKRMHLELRETMARVGADLKQRLVESVRSTWNTVYQLTVGRADDITAELECEVEQAVGAGRPRLESTSSELEDGAEAELTAGSLNQGRRVDYVLQEAPLESFNEYVSALTSHVMYWDSHDTMLLILKEIYSTMGIFPDSQTTVQQEEVFAGPSRTMSMGMDPTAPLAFRSDVRPPPMTGFVKK